MAGRVFPLGSYAWVPSETECFIPGRINTASFRAGEKGVVTLLDKREVDLESNITSKMESMNEESLKTVENMVQFKHLCEPSLLHNLRERFAQDEIYTSVGDILVAVNPFKMLPIYTPAILDDYKAKGASAMPPHVYGVADLAYKAMVETGQSQACIVSGESGAGKTETTKLFLQYITDVSVGIKGKREVAAATATTANNSRASVTLAAATLASAETDLQEQILKANPLMEAFGNAKTSRNDNSSRFGKYIQLRFNGKGTVVGGSITEYLLEKSRIVTQTEGERNYHIFFQVCAGAKVDSQMQKRLHIRDPDEYLYLSQSKTIHVDSINDTRGWEDTTMAMSVLGTSPEEREDILRTLAAVLHLGNIKFKSTESTRSGELVAQVSEKDDMLMLAAEQLGVSAQMLQRTLTSREIGAYSVIHLEYNNEQAGNAKDTLAKALYGNMFQRLIRSINLLLEGKTNPSLASSTAATIGVLDIFGFESFEHNSFEQCLINLANERLQFFFNDQIFSQEVLLYKAEGVNVSAIEFVNNDACLELLEERGRGVLSMIDEEIQVPKGSDGGLLNKLKSRFVSHKNLGKTNPKHKDSRNCFTVLHYAGPVTYNVVGWLVKNKDELHGGIEALMRTSKYRFIRELFPDPDAPAPISPKAASLVDATAASSTASDLAALDELAQKRYSSKRSSNKRVSTRKKTLGTEFKGQLQSLMVTLSVTNPHFVRCLKPNLEKQGDLFDSPMVLSQLRYAGLLEVCRIRQCGYPARREFAEFLYRFSPLASGSHSTAKDLCCALEAENLLESNDYVMGQSKVFLKTSALDILESKRDESLHAVLMSIQAVVRGFLCRKLYSGFRLALADLRTAMATRQCKTLAKALTTVRALLEDKCDQIGVVDEANTLLHKLERLDNVCELLVVGMDGREQMALQSAINEAREVGFDGPELQRAVEVLNGLEQEKAVLDTLTNAMDSREVGKLEAALAKVGQHSGLSGLDQVRQAQALHIRLKDETETANLLRAALTDLDLGRIVELITKLLALGLEDEEEELVKEAHRVRERLQSIQAGIKGIQNAQAQKSVDQLSRAIDKVTALQLSDTEESKFGSQITSAQSKLDSFQSIALIESDIQSATTSADMTALQTAIERAEVEGHTADSCTALQEGKQTFERLKNEADCRKQLLQAMESAELEQLSVAVARAAEIGLSKDSDFATAQNMLRKKGTRAELSSQMSAAVAEGDVDTLQELLVKAQVVEDMDSDIASARQALERLQDEKVALSSLKEAILECEPTALQDAITMANRFPALMSKCPKVLEEAKMALHLTSQCQSATGTGSSEDIENAIVKAKAGGLNVERGVLAVAELELRRLRVEQDIEERLLPLLAAKDKAGIVKLLQVVPSEMSNNDTVREARILIHRDEMIAETHEMLDRAVAEQDLDVMNEAMKRVFELGIVNDSVVYAKKLHVVLKEQREKCAEVIANMRSMQAKAKSRLGIVSADVNTLSDAIDTAVSKGLSKDVKELIEASELHVKVVRQLEIQEEMRAALLKGSLKQLKTALEHSQELDTKLEIADKVKAALKRKDAELRTAQRLAFEAGEEMPLDDGSEYDGNENDADADDDEDAEAAEQAKRRQFEERVQKALHVRYSFTHFHTLRTPDDFARGVYFNKRKIAENMLHFQPTVIARSLTELDKEQSRMATRMHKAVLGFCGDKSASFPETLVQDTLTKALEFPDLANELYLQLCKQLTHNTKAESIGRAWQLICMAVGTVPPTADLEMYLLNFIGTHRNVPGLIGNYAQYSLRRLEGILNSGASGFVPSVEEIQAYRERPPILATILMVDGEVLTEGLPLTPDLDVGKVVEICGHFLELSPHHVENFGIFVHDVSTHPAVPGPSEASRIATELKMSPRPLRNQDFLGDLVVQATQRKRTIKFVFARKFFLGVDGVDLLAGSPVKRDADVIVESKDRDSSVSEDDDEGEEIDESQLSQETFDKLLYMQAMADVSSGKLYIKDSTRLLQLTLLSITIDLEEFAGSRDTLNQVEVKDYLPPSVRDTKSEEEWKDAVVGVSDSITADTLLGFQRQYVKLCLLEPMFGACHFHVRKADVEGESQTSEMPELVRNLPEELEVVFNAEGMHFLNDTAVAKERGDLLLSFGYADLYRWGGSSWQFSVIIWDPAVENTFELTLYTTQANEMAGLILDYINAIMKMTDAGNNA